MNDDPGTAAICTAAICTAVIGEQRGAVAPLTSRQRGTNSDKSGLHGPNLCIEPAFVTSSLVLVNDAFTRHAVEHGHSLSKSTFRETLVTGFNRTEHPLDARAHHRALAGVTGTGLV